MSTQPKPIAEATSSYVAKKTASQFNWNYTEQDLRPLFSYECERCHDQGVIHYSDGATEACPEDCRASQDYRKARVAKTAAISSIPEDFQQYTSFQMWEALEGKTRNGKLLLDGKLGAILTAQYLAAHIGTLFSLHDVDARLFPNETMQGVGLVLYGGLGAGKTALACTVANVAMAHYRSSMFVYVPRWLEAIKDSFGGGPSMTDFNQMMLNCDLLILDDCNVPGASNFDSEKLEIMVRERSAKRRPYIITTNLQTGEEFVRVWGGQAWDIIAEKCLIVGMIGEPLRQKHTFGIAV